MRGIVQGVAGGWGLGVGRAVDEGLHVSCVVQDKDRGRRERFHIIDYLARDGACTCSR